MKKPYLIEKIKCAGCAGKIREALEELEGITEVEIDIAKKRVSLQIDEQQINDEKIRQELEKIGYPAI